MKKKVLVGMSGGVDSSAAAWLLQREGYEAVGVTLRLWEEAESAPRSCGPDGIQDAREVCRVLGIPHYVLDCRERFAREVVEPFAAEYLRGRTPNPCILCNRRMKFAALCRAAEELGAEYIATGHYARALQELKTGRHLLAQGKDPKKDQSYFLSSVTRDQLSRLLLPCGDYTKEEIRAFAAQSGLPVAKKKDSQDVCFIPDGDYTAFLERHTGCPQPRGQFVDEAGNPLGEHRGIGCYTIGQRKGLGIALGRPMFVLAIDPKENTVTLSAGESRLYSRKVIAEAVNFVSFPQEEFEKLTPVMARIRHSQAMAPGEALFTSDGKLRLWFREPQRAVTPGQTLVLYIGDLVACGGVITGTEEEAE